MATSAVSMFAYMCVCVCDIHGTDFPFIIRCVRGSGVLRSAELVQQQGLPHAHTGHLMVERVSLWEVFHLADYVQTMLTSVLPALCLRVAIK